MKSMSVEIRYQGQGHEVRQAVFVVGSHASCDLRLEGDGLDPAHLAILLGASGGCWVVPLRAVDREVLVDGHPRAAAWVDQDATIDVVGHLLELRISVVPEPEEVGLAPPEASAERRRLWAVWQGEEEPLGDRHEDPRAWAFQLGRHAHEAFHDLVQAPEGDVVPSLVAALRRWMGPCRVEVLRPLDPADAKGIGWEDTGEGDPMDPEFMALRLLEALAFREGAPRFTDDALGDPRLCPSAPIRYNLAGAMAAPLPAEGLSPLVVAAWRSVAEGSFDEREKVAFSVLTHLATLRRGGLPGPWALPTPLEFGPSLHFSGGRAPIRLEREWTILGRDSGRADVLLGSDDCSRRHAGLLRAPDDRVFLLDLGSSTGTYLNDHLVVAERVFDGDELRFGSTTRARLRHDTVGPTFAEEAMDLIRASMDWYAQACPGKAPPPGPEDA
jgi:hypothetical protein